MATTSTTNAAPSPLKTIVNFRDVGQIVNQVSSQSLLREGVLFRSARPDEASPEDRQALINGYHIKTIIDLRSDTEHVEQAKKLASQRQTNNADSGKQQPGTAVPSFEIPGIEYKKINLNGSSYSRALLWKLSWWNLAKFLTLHLSGYQVEALGVLGKEVIEGRGLIGLAKDSLEYSKAEIFQIFSVLAEPTTYPVLVHCTQGKDRTGLTILLLLLLLDVPADAIRADYETSDRELESERKGRVKEVARLNLGPEFAACAPGFVDSLREELDGKYGGVENFLGTCGIDGDMRKRIKETLNGKEDGG